MKTYQFTVDITEANGYQTFEIAANSPEEALKKIKAGEGNIISEDIEVQGLARHTATLTNDESA